MAILLVCPIRSKNLTSIHLETHLKRQRNGRDHLVFKRNEVKNTIDIEIELPRHVSAMIDEHVAARSPRLCLQGTPWLFPRRDSSGPTVPAYLSTRVKSRILRETGLVVNMHLFRHLACMIWLKKNPGQYEVARRLLGHSSVSQTMDAYADFETDSATQMYAELVDAVRRT